MNSSTPANDQSQNVPNTQWQTLHYDHEKYEQYTLLVKLFTIAVTLMCLISSQPSITSLLLISILWFQEAIWKTYQSRIGAALITIEQSEQVLAKPSCLENESPTFQLYSQWQQNRPNAKKLVSEYINNALKPTVLYPYLPLMVIVLFA